MRVKKFESPTLLPTLEALDAEFAREDEQCTTGRRRQEGAFKPTQTEFPAQLRAARPLNAMKQSSLDTAVMRLSLGRRVSWALARFIVVSCIGVAATLAWQSYGDAARAMIANSSSQLGWLAPQTAPVQTAPDVVARAAAAAASPDLQRLALGLASVRQSVDQLAAQFAAGQQQMVDDIAKLQADEQEILHKLSAAPPRPTAAPARKPAPVTPPSPSAQAR
jgi:hypothetical protein